MVEDNPFVKKSFKDGFHSIYLAISSSFWGTKNRVDKLNRESVKRVKEKNEELTILLHGYLSNYYRTMYSTIKFLKERGINVVSVGYNPKEPTRKSAELVKKQIDELMEQADVEKINLMGVSLGGLIARYYAEKLNGGKHINRMVTVYTPLKPVPEGDLGVRLNHFLGNNPNLANDGAREIEGMYSVKDYLAIYGIHDRIIKQEHTTSKKVRQVAVTGGHLLVSYNPKALDIAAKYIKGKKILENRFD